MPVHGYNPEFLDAARRRQALAQMRRRMRQAEDEAARLERAAKAAADAILAAAYEEARIIMLRAYDAQRQPRRPVAEIIGEVAEEFSVSPTLIRARGGIRRVREARKAAIRRTVREREDLSSAEIARIFGHIDPSTVTRAIREARHG